MKYQIFHNSCIWIGFLWVRIETRLSKFLKHLYCITFAFDFPNVLLWTVTIILWESDKPVEIVAVFWKFWGELVKKRSMQLGLRGFLKQVLFLTIFLRSFAYKNSVASVLKSPVSSSFSNVSLYMSKARLIILKKICVKLPRGDDNHPVREI